MSITTREKKLAVEQASEWLAYGMEMAEARADKAGEYGAALAEAVYRYMQSPQEVGRGALREAYSRYMAAHAGNFGPST